VPKVHKTIEQAVENLNAALPNIPRRYEVATSRASWAEPAASDQARANYQAGITEAIAEGRREARIREVGDAAYRQGCAQKGARVIMDRIRAAIPSYRTAFAPILRAMCDAADAAPARTRVTRENIENRLIPVINAAKQAAGKPTI